LWAPPAEFKTRRERWYGKRQVLEEEGREIIRAWRDVKTFFYRVSLQASPLHVEIG